MVSAGNVNKQVNLGYLGVSEITIEIYNKIA